MTKSLMPAPDFSVKFYKYDILEVSYTLNSILEANKISKLQENTRCQGFIVHH